MQKLEYNTAQFKVNLIIKIIEETFQGISAKIDQT